MSEFEEYLHDESKLTAKSVKEIFFPKSTEELSEFFIANQSSTGITVSGARTGVTGGAVPIVEEGEEPQILVSLEKLKQIQGIENRDGKQYIRVQSGVRLLEVSDYLKENDPGLFFPIDPTERSASFGGMIATNAGGARSFRYGSIRQWVDEITVVLSTGQILKVSRGQEKLSLLPQLKVLGEIVELNKPQVKNAIGPDLRNDMDLIDVFIGAEGIFGVVTEALIQLDKMPEQIVGFLQFFKEENSALDFVSKLREAYRTDIMAIEYFDKTSIEYALKSKKSFGDKLSHILAQGATSAVFFELDLGSYEKELDDFFAEYMELVTEVGGDAELCIMASDFTELEDIKAFRHAVPEQINACIRERKTKHPTLRKVATDMAVPDCFLHQVFELYRDRFSAQNLEFAIFGHVGDNHMHVNILPQDDAELVKALGAYKEISKEVVKMGGVVSAEHGIGRIKKEFFKEQFSEAQINQLRAIKKALDPELKLNRGVLFDL